MIPTCYRCGYDLSGHMATWESSCPVQGQCSECGLEFFWREILREDEQANPRHVEHCPRRAIPVAAVRTLLWCILPWVFWNRVKMHHEPRVRRMAAWLLIVLLGAQVFSGAAVALALWRVDVHEVQATNQQLPRFILGSETLVMRMERQQQSRELESWESSRLNAARQVIANPPQPTPIPPPRMPHFAKALAYPFAYVERYDKFGARAVSGMAVVRPPGSQVSDWEVEVLPFWRYPPYLVGAALSLGFPIMLMLLPATRKRLRIRPGHLLRASVFGFAWLAIPPTLRALESLSYIYTELTGSRGGPAQLFPVTNDADWPLWVWVISAWIAIWWLSVHWRGLRFPAPLFHWALLTTPVAIFAVAILAFALDPLAINALIDLDMLRDAPSYGGEFTPKRLAGGVVDRMP